MLVGVLAAFVVGIVAFEFDAYVNPVTPIAGINRVIIIKHEHKLELYRGSLLTASYRVALGRGGAGQKERAGDNRVPEGTYRVISHNPHSQFHNALRLSYPTPEQQAVARAKGVDPGGDIMIHGIRNGLGWVGGLQTLVDWTKGCVALTDAQIDIVAREVADGTNVEILP
jgi:murein L,D-transpeptidase YafK